MLSWLKRFFGAGKYHPLAVFLIGMGVAAYGGRVTQQAIDQHASGEFLRNAQRTSVEVSRRFHHSVLGLTGMKATVATYGKMSREKFRTYIESRNLPKEFPGVRGFGFIEHVARADLDAFIAKERADNAPQFALRQLNDKNHDDFYIIARLEPAANNKGAHGLDLGSEVVRREGLQRAVDSGTPAITRAVTLVQDQRKTPGMLLFVPVYQTGAPTGTVAERRAALLGLIYSPIVVDELLNELVNELVNELMNEPPNQLKQKGYAAPNNAQPRKKSDLAAQRIDFKVFDAAPGQSDAKVLFDSANRISPPGVAFASGTGPAAKAQHRFSLRQALAVPGRQFAIEIHSTPQFDAAIDRSSAWLTFGLGALLSALMALLLRQQSTGLLRATALASKMTADLNRLAQVVEHTSNAVSIHDQDNRITWINHGFTRVTGYSLEEAMGKTQAELFNTPDDPQLLAKVQAAMALGRGHHTEENYRAKDGHEFWLEKEIQLQYDAHGKHIGFMKIGSDVTERRAIEQEAKRNAALLRGAIDALDEAFVLYDPDDRLVFCNDKYLALYALSADMIVPGNKFEDIVRAGAERGQYAAAIGNVDEWVAERVRHHLASNTTLVQRIDGGRSLRIVERKLPDGHIVGFRIDITELVQASEAALAASLSKSQFLANMSHELRTPMNAVLGMLTLLRKTDLSPRQADYATKSENAARSLLALLNEILDFSKIEAGKMALDLHPFRMDQVMRDLSVILAANVGQKQLEVLFDIDPQLPRRLVGDAMRLQQVLINLSSNAIKFTERGEVVISIKVLAQSEVDVSLEIAVRDTGIGIAPEHHASIFGGFNQAEGSTTRRFGGSGLGLAISQHLVGLMGGQIVLESRLGHGSTFHFCVSLPLQAQSSDDLAHEDTVQPPLSGLSRMAGLMELPGMAGLAGMTAGLSAGLSPLSVLVVDDNATARAIMAEMTQSLGWRVDVAASGEQALGMMQAKEAAKAHYDVVFLDWQMPGLDGWQTCQRMHDQGLHRQSPIVVMITAHDREMLAQRSAAEQAMLGAYLVKPITASMLFDAIHDARVGGHTEGHNAATALPDLAKQRLSGMRLLVAEDNANNQQVVRELLEAEGARVEIVNNGQEAIDAIVADLAGLADPAGGAGSSFDVVLMDLQMPVMDGFMATRHIRGALAMHNLPIVAMTANAMASDREACLAAGMNHHIGKPFDLDYLVKVLRQQASWPGVAQAENGAHANADSDNPNQAGAAPLILPQTLVDAATIAQLELRPALARLGGKQDIYHRMLRTFVSDLKRMPDELHSHLAAGDRLANVRLLHTLKGLAATLGLPGLASAAERAEQQCASQSENAALQHEDIVSHICREIHGMIPQLAALLLALENASAPASTPQTNDSARQTMDKPAMLAALQTLAAQLHQSDMGAIDTMADLQTRCASMHAGGDGADGGADDSASAFVQALNALDEAVNALQFEHAFALCTACIAKCEED
jgi:PAS domain S-box-containing protein